ncbi:MAG TPA: Rrf2 family transcriptional regulator [Sneathiellales bacterium]|jgi:Rrf2 family protein|nr:Rrf2 family transcriptional regulator [Sneathiellales bacterium]
MLRLSKKTLFALEAVVDVACNSRPSPVQSRSITHRQGIPQRYLEQVMQELVRAGILKGLRGPKGGYRLARERRRVTVGEIVRVVGALDLNKESGHGGTSELGYKVVYPVWNKLQKEMMDRLNSITVEDLCNLAQEAGLTPEDEQKQVDFNI